MIRIGLIGTGNVAIALAREIRNHQTLSLVQLIGRDQNKLPNDLIDIPFSKQFNALPTCDVVLIAVSDQAIQQVSSQIYLTDAVVAHTSGASSVDLLSNHKHRGVFYPLQTFSKQQQGKPINEFLHKSLRDYLITSTISTGANTKSSILMYLEFPITNPVEASITSSKTKTSFL